MIKIVKKVGETVEESRLIDGALIDQKSMGRGGPTRVEKAQIGLIQFQLSPPKTDVSRLTEIGLLCRDSCLYKKSCVKIPCIKYCKL